MKRYKITLMGLFFGLSAYLGIFHNNPSVSMVFAFDPQGPLVFKAFQWVTSHWVHWGLSHMAWDLLAWAIVAGALERKLGSTKLIAHVLVISFFLSIGLNFFYANIEAYAGLSGLVSGLFGCLVACQFHERKWKTGLWWLLLFALKLALELGGDGEGLFSGTLGMDAVSFPPSHLMGFVIGLFVSLLPLLKRFDRTSECFAH